MQYHKPLLYSAQHQQMRSLEAEIDNYKKGINKEQERNEELTMMLNKLNADIGHIKKQIDSSMIKNEALKVEYMTYTRTLQETEQSLAKAKTVSTIAADLYMMGYFVL